MTWIKSDASRQVEISDSGKRLVFGIGRFEKIFLVFVAGLRVLTLWGSITRPVDDVIYLFELFFVGFAIFYTYSFRLTIDDGFIVQQALGKFHAISIDDVRAWHVRYLFNPLGLYILESKSGAKFEFPATIERPRELESFLDSIKRRDVEGVD